MSKMLVGVAAWLALAAGAHAQTAAPSTTSPAPAPAAQPSDTAKPAGGQTAGGQTATGETYKMKDGGMYQPPAQRPASPAQDLSVYGRT